MEIYYGNPVGSAIAWVIIALLGAGAFIATGIWTVRRERAPKPTRSAKVFIAAGAIMLVWGIYAILNLVVLNPKSPLYAGDRLANLADQSAVSLGIFLVFATGTYLVYRRIVRNRRLAYPAQRDPGTATSSNSTPGT